MGAARAISCVGRKPPWHPGFPRAPVSYGLQGETISVLSATPITIHYSPTTVAPARYSFGRTTKEGGDGGAEPISVGPRLLGPKTSGFGGTSLRLPGSFVRPRQPSARFCAAGFSEMRAIVLLSCIHVGLGFWTVSMPRKTAGASITMSLQKEAQHRPAGERRAASRAMLSIGEAEVPVAIQDAGAKGLGVFATERIEAGVYVGEYEGEILSGRDIEVRYEGKGVPNAEDLAWRESREEREIGVTGDYIYGCGEDIFVDAEDSDLASWCRFINHAPMDSEECNLQGKSLPKAYSGKPKVWFVTRRAIDPGEELHFDYGDEYFW